jgi:hypothetical protein
VPIHTLDRIASCLDPNPVCPTYVLACTGRYVMVFTFEHFSSTNLQYLKPPRMYRTYLYVYSLVHDCTGSSLRICEVPYKPYSAIRYCTYVNQNSKLQSGIQTKQNYQNIPTLHHDDPTNSNSIGIGWIIMAGSRHRIGKHECCCMLYHCFLSHMVYCCLVATGCHFDNMAGGSSMLGVWMTINYFHPQAKHGNMVSFWKPLIFTLLVFF